MKKLEELEKRLLELQAEVAMLKKGDKPRFYAMTIIYDDDNLEWVVGPDQDITRDEAKDWVDSLGDGWRMPTTDELKTLYQSGIGSRNIDPLFQTTGWFVWSDKIDGSSVFTVYFGSGDELPYARDFSYLSRVFAARPRRRG